MSEVQHAQSLWESPLFRGRRPARTGYAEAVALYHFGQRC